MKTICDNFLKSINNQYGSKKNFEREMIKHAYKFGNKGRLYLNIDNNLLFSFEGISSENTILACNLDNCDIINFIEDLDYIKLSNSYNEIIKLIKS